MTDQRQKNISQKNRRMVTALVLLVGGMGGLAYASVPLYQLFCQITGYGGTPKIAADTPDVKPTVAASSEKEHLIKVRFDANTSKKLPWEFKVKQTEVTVKLGEENLAFYEVTNLSDKPITGRATYNVTPYKAGPYFSKIACFCFDEQTVQPGETVTMPVQYSVDPEMLEDANMQEVKTITLSYTFFRVKDPENGEKESEKISRLKTGEATTEKIKG